MPKHLSDKFSVQLLIIHTLKKQKKFIGMEISQFHANVKIKRIVLTNGTAFFDYSLMVLM